MNGLSREAAALLSSVTTFRLKLEMLKKNDPAAPSGDRVTKIMSALELISKAIQLKNPLPCESNATPGSLAASYV